MIYLHIGFPKTATTTIQAFLSSNRSFLETRNLVYPELATSDEERLGVSARAHNALAVELRRGEPGSNWRRLKAMMAAEPERNYLVSGEALSGIDPAVLKSAIGDVDAVIISYVRPWVQLIQSQYSHLTKIGVSVVGFDQFFDERLERPTSDLHAYYWRWCNVFGVSNVRVRTLDLTVMRGGDVRHDILQALDIDVPDDFGSGVVLTKPTNEALGWKSVEILRKLNVELRQRYLGGRDASAFREEKRARHRRLESPLLDFAAELSKAAAKVGADLGFDDRGRYLSLRQQRRSSRLFDRHMRMLQRMGLNVAATETANAKFVERPFLPTYEAIPRDEVGLFLDGLRSVEQPANLQSIDWSDILDQLGGDAA